MSIRVTHLVKHYSVYRRQPGLQAALRSLFHREYETVKAVDDISFTIDQGEIVGFLGPNGAGKTTTLKCLAGLLHPTSGEIAVAGFTPHHREPRYLKQFTLVMGQRNQLMWDLPAMETFLVNQAMYAVPDAPFKAALDELIGLLGLEPLLNKQVRKLSLGERMKCELASALLHRPQLIFLDEPTLGLDINAQVAIRDFIRSYNQRYQATVLLTSHYMADVSALAKRILVIDHGKLIYDGDLQALVERTAPYKLLKLSFDQPVAAADLVGYGEIETHEFPNVTLRVARHDIKAVAAQALAALPVADVTVEDPPIDTIIRQVFNHA
jgi:ABC-2 type transport system ATP-binding protein